ncbi:transmembrane protein, putative [Medicago truncatula]|uniref:Transmembrane protein, putative n=1 Tax=Medicago truncatula TaxID=3880 RepID=A0A072V781_MEDTR|nr:transmembrane protein, putative [Medicago truncatula]
MPQRPLQMEENHDHQVDKDELKRSTKGMPMEMSLYVLLVKSNCLDFVWLTPKTAIHTIKSAIQTQFQGSYHCWSETPVEERDRWWQLFQDKVSWDPCHHELVYNAFKKRCTNYLIHMKARKKGVSPGWIDEQAWLILLPIGKVHTSKGSTSQSLISLRHRRCYAKKHVPYAPIDKRYLAAHEWNDKSVDCPSKRTYDTGSEKQETDEVMWLQIMLILKSLLWKSLGTGLTTLLTCLLTFTMVYRCRLWSPRHLVTLSGLNSMRSLDFMKTQPQLYKTVLEVLERAKKAQQRVDQFYEQMIDMVEQLKQRMTSQKRQSGCIVLLVVRVHHRKSVNILTMIVVAKTIIDALWLSSLNLYLLNQPFMFSLSLCLV